MKTLGYGLVIGTLVAVCSYAGACVQGDPTVSQLQAMLSQVPAEAAAIESGWATVRFADFEALFASEGLSLLRALGSVDLLMNSVSIGAIMSRIVTGPQALNYVFSNAGKMKDAVGFEWLLDVDRSLEFGDPPQIGLLLGGGFDAGTIGVALQARGFEVAEVEGSSVWHRFDDLAISLEARDLADPFGGHIGASARVALLPNTLANTRTWQGIEMIVRAAQGIHPSLGDDPRYRALTGAISENEGLLIQALFFSGIALRFGGNPMDAVEGQSVDGEPLPDYSAAVLADRQEGDDQVHLIGLACADVPTAQTAARVLLKRVKAFSLPDQPGELLSDRFGATVSIREGEWSQEGVAIAVVEASYPLPAEPTDPETGLHTVRAPLFRTWIQAILRREFTILR